MSSIIEFFVAPDNAVAAGVTEGGPGKAVSYGNFDVWSALEEWESILTGRDAEGPDVVAGDDGPLVLLVPAALTAALAGADGELLRSTASRWVAVLAAEGDEIDEELAHEMITEVAALSAKAAGSGGSLYCWVG